MKMITDRMSMPYFALGVLAVAMGIIPLNDALIKLMSVDVSLGQFVDRDFAEALEAGGVLGSEAQVAVLLDLEFGFGALEVEPGGQFAAGLVDGVEDFLAVYFGDDVECGHMRGVCGGGGRTRTCNQAIMSRLL